jgi:sialidase-1
MNKGLHVSKRCQYLSLYTIVILLLLTACKKEGLRADYTLSVIDNQTAITDVRDGEARLADAVIVKKDAFSPDSYYPGGYAYSSVMKYDNGVYVIASMGHAGLFDDFFPGVINYKKSYDSGRTWTKTLLMQENIGQVNVMHPTVTLLPDGNMLSLFLVKNSRTDLNIMCKTTADTGQTWSPLVDVGVPHTGYKITMNGRLCQTFSGRLILPVSFMQNVSGNQNVQLIFCYISDDHGLTWRKTKSYGSDVVMLEPGITELGDGTLLMCIRSTTGKVMFSVSRDGGESWESILKSTINTPEAPEAIAYSKKYKALFMVWNDAIYNPAFFLNRSTLSIAVSFDNGINWKKLGNLDKDDKYLFFYPALVIDNDELIVTYSRYKRTEYHPSVVFERLSISKLIN